ncbi:MAG: hypothetical protein KF775_11520 [Cyclobacteriaceae bacterium]|nr:hypothetical protein [Cyclobacteriaceae bacterium]
MNYIRHLLAFFDRVALDERLNPTHISLYMALFQYWNYNRFQSPISISRSEMMAVSKIHAKATYHKVIKELHEYGLIIYRPSYNPFRGSEVELVQWADNLESNKFKEETSTCSENELTVNQYLPKISTATVPINEPPYKHINNTNIAYATSPKIEQANGQDKKVNGQSKNGIHKKIASGAARSISQIPPQLHEVEIYFDEINSTKLEGQKFFNYFQSNGWKVGGRAPMKDWRAAARNWLLNAAAFKPKQKTISLHTTTVKDYGEPL